MKKQQTGATLIVVLILLLVITVIGTLAIRSSLTSLNIATNSQGQQLLLQNSDAAIFNVESPNLLQRNTAYDGLFGLVKTDANKGKELVFCYKGTATSFYDISRASFMQWVSGTAPNNSELGVDGYCKLDSSDNFFTSGRKAVMTQVSIKVNTDTSSALVGLDRAFEHMQRGTDAEAAKIDKSEKMLVTATSIVPSMSSASDTDINDCFKLHMNQVVIPSGVTPATGMNKSVSQCLQDLGVPVNTQITEYNLTQAFERT
ncbi:PilX N-terminal domain-containing pilus assembly protein [Acinetobacter terrae]|uniref:Pilus assembly protein PilX n=1 Tax=Acinetobacter terrae TaxID=2731247 RepID=A0A4R0EPD7_9GAMM|nr:PilX N-terminal domain-containing pilus assembly protein [Acinetobacter terrae]TCB60663.1 pilus assembly protein PilX [Acinetobacter terrae]